MAETTSSKGLTRRTVLGAGAAAGALQVASPFIVTARGEAAIKLGMVDPLTGIASAVAQSEVEGARFALEQVNKKGGILGRPVELLIEDSAMSVGTGVQKTRKLIDRDQVSFLQGNVNSALSLAMAGVAAEKGVLHIVPGGHTDAVTGTSCHWNVFRVCNTTQMEANAVAPTLMKAGGKTWYYITPDYAFGHTLQAGLEKAAAKLGGTKVGAALAPLGTTDFSSYLIQAQASNPDVIILLPQGADMINVLKQAVQFGLDKRLHLAGAQQELEALEGLPPEARIGTWVFEWYWNQSGVPHLQDFVDAIRKKTGKVPTARTYQGYVATWTCALAANAAGSLDAVKMARALQGMKLPPEVGLMPEAPFYREGDNQLMPTLYVGNAQAEGSTPEDLFRVTGLVKGPEAAGPVQESGCNMIWPA